uniref:Uncharacterized protein n=1 Tax=Rhizophora mucronata TaxID=61149 RepID=A0A2P2NBU2_RHIMU
MCDIGSKTWETITVKHPLSQPIAVCTFYVPRLDVLNGFKLFVLICYLALACLSVRCIFLRYVGSWKF